jgi:hypothetical protein
MRYGFYLPTRGPTATRDGVLALAREGERLGLHSAMIADHIVFPVESESAYPYTLDGKHPGGGDALETFSILGVVAGATERLRLVTSVLVLPYRNPVLTAKMVASLDVLSGGRVTLGVGVGWLKEEFEALQRVDRDVWREEIIAARFDWSREKNIHALAVRVYRLPTTIKLPMHATYGGCKSWIELAREIPTDGMKPVLGDDLFNQKLDRFTTALEQTNAI